MLFSEPKFWYCYLASSPMSPQIEIFFFAQMKCCAKLGNIQTRDCFVIARWYEERFNSSDFPALTQVKYCSDACQEEGKVLHKLECSVMEHVYQTGITTVGPLAFR